MENKELQGNEGKSVRICCDGSDYLRIPIRTKLITKEDDIAEAAKEFAGPHLTQGDILFISEKAVACSQGRAIPMEEIKPRRLARFLVKFVCLLHNEPTSFRRRRG